MIPSRLAAILPLVVLLGCSSADPSQGSVDATDAGAPSPIQCEGLCVSSTDVAFEESNENDRLSGALVKACYRGRCAEGTLVEPSVDGATVIGFSASDPSNGPTYGTVAVGAEPSRLRFSLKWQIDRATAVDGDIFSVEARSPDGKALFVRTYTATYQERTVCGSVCIGFRDEAKN